MQQKNQIPAYITAAQICLIISAVWAIFFLVSVNMGFNQSSQVPLIKYVLPGNPPVDIFSAAIIEGYGSYALFILITRFFLIFSFGWPLFTRIIHAIQLVSDSQDD